MLKSNFNKSKPKGIGPNCPYDGLLIMSTWHWRWDKTYKCKTPNAGAWFIGMGFSKFHDFSMIIMTYHYFSRNSFFSRFSRPCGNSEPKIWQMTLKNKRALFLCYFKLCASLRSHMCMNSYCSYSPEMPYLGQNRQFFCAVWPWNWTDDIEKQ